MHTFYKNKVAHDTPILMTFYGIACTFLRSTLPLGILQPVYKNITMYGIEM